jgi:hypothetical protein
MQQEKVKFLKAAILNWCVAVIIFFTWILTGCSHANKDFHHVVTLENVKVHIVSDINQIDSADKQNKKTINGRYSGNNEIWLIGYKDSSGVRVKMASLGHKLLNLIHSKNKGLSHPQTY